MLKRKITNALAEWKERPNHKPLIIKGARQVGKTFIVEQFIKDAYKNSITLNFIEHPQYCDIFAGDLSANSIVKQISLLVPGANLNTANTVLFLDEIQQCPNAITALKFLATEASCDVIATGSLLGVSYKHVSSFPVGYIDYMEMASLDFEEFLWALEVPATSIRDIREYFEEVRAVPQAMHNRMFELFKEYLVIGGMPEVVQDFASTSNFASALRLQRAIVNGYLDDIAKYAEGAEKNKVRACFLSVPKQLAKDYKKFQYSVVERGGTARKFGGSLMWLLDAGITAFCHNLSQPELPFEGYAENDNFKVYMRDTGLLVSMLDDGAQADIIKGNLGIYKGAIYENIIADIFVKSGKKLYSFMYRSGLEMDFFIRHGGKATAIEVKSAQNKKSRSLTSLMSERWNVGQAIKLSYDNVGQAGSVLTLPLYMAMFL
jgi:predicted AAA+ superfamily ATPase